MENNSDDSSNDSYEDEEVEQFREKLIIELNE